MIPLLRRINKGAFQGRLNCPNDLCPSTRPGKTSRWAYVEHISPTRIRYRCKDCHKTIQYDFTYNPNNHLHPYGPYTKNIWTNVVDAWKDRKVKK